MTKEKDISNLYGEGTFNPDKPTYVITHGFDSNGRLNEDGIIADNDWLKDMADSIKNRDPNANVIVVDWKNEAAPDFLSAGTASVAHIATGGRTTTSMNQALEVTDLFENAAHNTASIGEKLGKELLEKYGVNPENTQLIGHSLGAHVSGAAGSYIHKNHPEGTKINSIIALDPAGPGFQSNDPIDLFWDRVSEKLDPQDAENIVAIHSSEFFGTDSAVGTLDLYVNYEDLFQPNSEDFVDNHAYAHQLFISLLRGDIYEQLNGASLSLESLYQTKGRFNVDTKTLPVIKRDISKINKLKFESKKHNKIGQERNSEFLSIKEKFEYIEKLVYFTVDKLLN